MAGPKFTAGPGAGNPFPAVNAVDALGIHVFGDPDAGVVFVTIPLSVDAAIDLAWRVASEATALRRAQHGGGAP